VFAVGRPVAAQAAQERKHLVADGLVHQRGFFVFEVRPAQVLLVRPEGERLVGAGPARSVFGAGLEVVEAADE
jgi:hypothetical protein